MSIVIRGRSKRRSGMTIMKAVLFLFAFLSTAQAADFSSRVHLSSPPQKLPPLVFEDADGVQHALSDYRGRFVLLNVWETWCGPCAHEMPSLDKLQDHFDPQKLIILPLSQDHEVVRVSAFYRSHALTHLPIAIDTAGHAPSAFHLRGLPTTLIVDPLGQEVARIEGDVDWNSTEVFRFLRDQIRNP